MNTKLLETFVELSRTPHLRKVADRLHATPSALSARVKNLEEQLGLELFTSDNKMLSLTEAGRCLIPYAEAALKAIQELRGAATEAHKIIGAVRIGVIEAAVFTLLPELVRSLKSELENISVTWVVGLTAELQERLGKAELDLVLSLDRLAQIPYAVSEELVSLETSWIAKKGLVTHLEDESCVFSHQILTPMSNTGPSEDAARTVQNLAFRHGISPTRIQLSTSPSLSALIMLVRNGVGIGIFPATLVGEELARGELEILPVSCPSPMVIRQWHLLTATSATRMVSKVVQGVASRYRKSLRGSKTGIGIGLIT